MRGAVLTLAAAALLAQAGLVLENVERQIDLRGHAEKMRVAMSVKNTGTTEEVSAPVHS